jgi:hypothetical protein
MTVETANGAHGVGINERIKAAAKASQVQAILLLAANTYTYASIAPKTLRKARREAELRLKELAAEAEARKGGRK